MTTQVVFNVDSKIKAKAMQRAKREGVPFASVLKFATKAFADGEFSVGILEIRPEKMRLYDRESRLMDAGKGKRLSDMKGFRTYLRDL